MVNGLLDLSKELCEQSPRYAAIINSRHPFWSSFGESSREYIDALAVLGVERLRPLLLAVLSNFERDETLKVLKLMVSWAVRFLIVGIPGGTAEDTLNDAAKEISDKRVSNAKELIVSLGKIIPSDGEFQSKFEIATVAKSQLYHYYLRSIEQSYDESETEPAKVVNVRTDVINVEHVIPRNPSALWTLEKEVMDAYCNRIGNMTLMRTKPNAEAGNSTFDIKKPYYEKEQSLQMTIELMKYETWGPIEIDARQAKWAERAVKIWSIKGQASNATLGQYPIM